MKYSIIMATTAPSLLIRTACNAIVKNMTPDEIIIEDNFIGYYNGKGNTRPATALIRALNKTKNDIIMILDNDIIVTDPIVDTTLLQKIQKPNIFSSGVFAKIPRYRGNLPRFPIVLSPCMLMRKDWYLKTGIPLSTSSGTTTPTMIAAYEAGQRFEICFDLKPYVPHLVQGSTVLYPKVKPLFYNVFDMHNEKYNTHHDLGDYLIDADLVYSDIEHMTAAIMFHFDKYWGMQRRETESIEIKHPLTYKYTRYLEGFNGYGLLQFTDSEMQILHQHLTGKASSPIIQELVEFIKRDSTWTNHPECHKGILDDILPNPKWCKTISNFYNDIDLKYIKSLNNRKGLGLERIPPQMSDSAPNFCTSIQNYLLFCDNYRQRFYKRMVGKRIMYIGEQDDLASLNSRRSLSAKKLGYYPFFNKNLEEVSTFFDKVDITNWDLFFVDGGLLGKVLITRLQDKRKMAFDMGKVLQFKPPKNLQQILSPVHDDTLYKLNVPTKDFTGIYSLDDLKKGL